MTRWVQMRQGQRDYASCWQWGAAGLLRLLQNKYNHQLEDNGEVMWECQINGHKSISVSIIRWRSKLFTRAAGAIMVIWEAMLQANTCPAGLAAVGIDTVQFLLAFWDRALGLPVHFSIVHWVATLHRLH